MIKIKKTQNNTKYYLNDKLHREDGPAVEYSGGDKEYWYHGKKIKVNFTEEFIRMVNLVILR